MIQTAWSAGAKALTLTADGVPWTGEALSLTLTEDLSGGGDVALGSANASVLRLTLAGESRDWGGRRLTAALGGVPLGVFTVTAAEARAGRTELEAMDALGTAFGDEYVPAAGSGTALGVIRAICAAAGVTLGDVSGLTDVPVSGLTAGHTRRETLGLMAALLGRNVHMDRTGALVLRWYAPGGVTLTEDDWYPGELTMGDRDYAVERLACAVTRAFPAADTDGTVTEDTETAVLTAGTGTTGISLTDDYMTQDILDGVYGAVGGFAYRPMTVTFLGDARIEAGDILTVTDGAGISHAAPAMKVVHAWDGGVKTTVTAFGNPAAEVSVSAAGSLSKAVSHLMAEFARFKSLEADNLRALKANLGTAVIGVLSAGGVSADWINAGALTVRDSGNDILFQADRGNGTVQIAGFTVEDDRLASPTIELDTAQIRIVGPRAGSQWSPQAAVLNNAILSFFGFDSYGQGVRGYMGIQSDYDTGATDGYLHIKSLFQGRGIVLGRDTDTLMMVDTVYDGVRMYGPVWMYDPDNRSRYSTLTYQKVKDWDACVPKGDTLAHTSGTVSVASGTATNLCSLTLPAGKYVIVGNVNFASNATGYRAMCVNQTSGSVVNTRGNTVRVRAVSGEATMLNMTTAPFTVEAGATQTRYLNVQHTAGSTLNCSASMFAIRIQ